MGQSISTMRVGEMSWVTPAQRWRRWRIRGPSRGRAPAGWPAGTVTLVQGLVVLHLRGARATCSPTPPHGLFFRDTRFALPLRAAASTARSPSRSRPRDSDRPLQRHLRAPHPAPRRPPARQHAHDHALPLRRPGHARGHRRPQLRRGGRILLGRAPASTPTSPTSPSCKEGRVDRALGRRSPSTRSTVASTSGSGGGAVRRGAQARVLRRARPRADRARFETIVPPRGDLADVPAAQPRHRRRGARAAHRCGDPVERATPAERWQRWRRGLPVGRDRPRGLGAHRAARRRRPGRAAHLRPGAARAGGRGRGRAVGHDAVRARLAAHGAGWRCSRPRPRARRARDPRPVPGHATSTRAPRRSPAASCTRCASAPPRRSRSAAAPLLRHRSTPRPCS